MKTSRGRKKVGSDIIQIKNVFDEDLVSFLFDDCQNQLKFNLLKDNYIFSPKIIYFHQKLYTFIKNYILLTKPIIDCHGLVICENGEVKKDLEFPYSIRNWNLFCLKIQNSMFDYCDKFGIDKSELTPHSCWVERSLISKEKSIIPTTEMPIDDNDSWLDSFCGANSLTHYRVVYFLKNPNPTLGIKIYTKKKVLNLLGEENSLYIIPSNSYNSYIEFPTDNEKHFILMFDWYLHPKDSPNDPTWIFPNKYNNKNLKQYIKILKKKLTKK